MRELSVNNSKRREQELNLFGEENEEEMKESRINKGLAALNLVPT
jgi:hypothetical protein